MGSAPALTKGKLEGSHKIEMKINNIMRKYLGMHTLHTHSQDTKGVEGVSTGQIRTSRDSHPIITRRRRKVFFQQLHFPHKSNKFISLNCILNWKRNKQKVLTYKFTPIHY